MQPDEETFSELLLSSTLTPLERGRNEGGSFFWGPVLLKHSLCRLLSFCLQFISSLSFKFVFAAAAA